MMMTASRFLFICLALSAISLCAQGQPSSCSGEWEYDTLLNAPYWEQLSDVADDIFDLSSEQLLAAGCGDAPRMLDETFLIACEIRFQLRQDARADKDVLVAEAAHQGFLLVPDMVMALASCEPQGRLYPEVRDVMPQLVQVVRNFDVSLIRKDREDRQRLRASFSCNIQNGDTTITRGEFALQIRFSKPMKGGISLGFGTGGGMFPALARGNGSVCWNSDHTVQTIWLRLDPHTTYSFSIQGHKYRTLDGYPASGSLNITFTTRE